MEKNAFGLPLMQKRGLSKAVIASLIGVVVLLILVANMAPTALIGLFNTSAFTGVPTWVPTVLGILGVVAFIFVILKAVE